MARWFSVIPSVDLTMLGSAHGTHALVAYCYPLPAVCSGFLEASDVSLVPYCVGHDVGYNVCVFIGGKRDWPLTYALDGDRLVVQDLRDPGPEDSGYLHVVFTGCEAIPHYLVYLDEHGDVVSNHTEAKHLLDLLRSGCRPFEEPVEDVVKAFNKATAEGARMGKYSELLTDAIHSMIEVTEERDIDSLFTGGHTTALTQTIAGLDDFELIAFVAVVHPSTGGGHS